MPFSGPKSGKVVDAILLVAIAGPVVGLLMGGIYSMPAMRLSKGREPWLSLMLGAGLAVTVFGISYLGGTPLPYAAGAWLLSIALLLLARRMHGTLDGNLERFGKVHAPALLIALVLAGLTGSGTAGFA